jgi:hypothetical protein
VRKVYGREKGCKKVYWSRPGKRIKKKDKNKRGEKYMLQEGPGDGPVVWILMVDVRGLSPRFPSASVKAALLGRMIITRARL